METLQDFEMAREERLWDGVSLWCSQRAQGGIYLLGYHAEMTLKSAYFRLTGLSIAKPIDRYVLQTALGKAKLLGVSTPHEGYHGLRFWCDLLVAERSARGIPLPSPLLNILTHQVDIISSRWSVEMRYRTPSTRPLDLESTVTAVDWLDRNFVLLYT